MTERLPQFHLSLFGKELVQTQSVKDFGVTFDKNVTHNNHVVNTVSSCLSALDSHGELLTKYCFV